MKSWEISPENEVEYPQDINDGKEEQQVAGIISFNEDESIFQTPSP